MANELSILPIDDPFRKAMADQLLGKLHHMGLILLKKDMSQCNDITVSSFCRYKNLY